MDETKRRRETKTKGKLLPKTPVTELPPELLKEIDVTPGESRRPAVQIRAKIHIKAQHGAGHLSDEVSGGPTATVQPTAYSGANRPLHQGYLVDNGV